MSHTPQLNILLLEEASLTAGQSTVLRAARVLGRGEGAPPWCKGAGGAVRMAGGGPATAVHLLKLFYNIARAFKIIPFLQNIPS